MLICYQHKRVLTTAHMSYVLHLHVKRNGGEVYPAAYFPPLVGDALVDAVPEEPHLVVGGILVVEVQEAPDDVARSEGSAVGVV